MMFKIMVKYYKIFMKNNVLIKHINIIKILIIIYK